MVSLHLKRRNGHNFLRQKTSLMLNYNARHNNRPVRRRSSLEGSLEGSIVLASHGSLYVTVLDVFDREHPRSDVPVECRSWIPTAGGFLGFLRRFFCRGLRASCESVAQDYPHFISCRRPVLALRPFR